MNAHVDKKLTIDNHGTLQGKIYEFKHRSNGECPSHITMNYNTFNDLGSYPYPYISRPPHKDKRGVSYMGIKVIRTYDIEEGEFLIF